MFCDGKRVVVSAMLHVDRVLQLSGALCCTWTSSCYIRGWYVARRPSLATFGGAMLHVDPVLQHSGALCWTWTSGRYSRVRGVALHPALRACEGRMWQRHSVGWSL